jgi:arsenate reductase (thioredoxin)
VLKTKIQSLTAQFENISSARKQVLAQLSSSIREKRVLKEQVQLNFICTHNSRRSHIAQIWAQTATYHYGIENVTCYSGGTEATAVSPNVITALRNAGFKISIAKNGDNPTYTIQVSDDHNINVVSKHFNDPANPSTDFIAVMVCSDADKNCQLVPGASERIAITYNDPKASDGTPNETAAYQQTVDEIGREMLYAFSMIDEQ